MTTVRHSLATAHSGARERLALPSYTPPGDVTPYRAWRLFWHDPGVGGRRLIHNTAVYHLKVLARAPDR